MEMTSCQWPVHWRATAMPAYLRYSGLEYSVMRLDQQQTAWWTAAAPQRRKHFLALPFSCVRAHEFSK